MTVEEVTALTEILQDAVNLPARITDWELNFAQDMLRRLLHYDTDTFISEKQLAVIERIERKIYSV